MADILEESDAPDDIDDDMYQHSGEMTLSDQETDYLPPLDRLYQYSISDNIFNRQMVGRNMVETLRIVHQTPGDVERVLSIIEKTAKDSEPGVRGEMMEHLPHIAMVCSELRLPCWHSLVDTRLVPVIMASITDIDNQVRKTAQTAILVLMEQNLIGQPYIEEELCSSIVNLTFFDTYADYHPSIITLMSKLAPLLGKHMTEDLLVPRFTTLCSHAIVAIRKTCASNFSDFCAVVSKHVTETQLLGRFCELARDSDWGVRKACAEVVMAVSVACCLQTRRLVLAPVFASLLADVVRWVRVSAFQTLGPFITTFAEPSITSLAYNTHGELLLTNPEGFEFRFLNQKTDHSNYINNDMCYEEHWSKEEDQHSTRESSEVPEPEPAVDSQYNSFIFWREPLPDIDPDLNKPNIVLTLPHFSKPSLSDKMSNSFNQGSESLSLCSHLASKEKGFKLRCGSVSPEPTQDIVPQLLIDHFVSMCDVSHASTTDIDMAHHCAFSLPAVALTLGPQNWDLLRDAYTALASDRQWKVRRTVASSIHELAVIVGEDRATQDLVPIFSGLIKDLDEVRIGALRHLAYFLKLLRPVGRNQFLPRLADFLKTEYDYNWRFRDELAKQLYEALRLFSPSDAVAHLTPVAICLLLDNVAAVRHTALKLVTELVSYVSLDIALLRGLLAELAEQFAHSSRWSRRQTFAQLCSLLVRGRVLADDMFARDVLPHLLDLSWDRVPNVRLAVARTIAADIMNNQYFCNEQNPHHEVLIQTLKRLQSDKDRDVRYYASLTPLETLKYKLHKELAQMKLSPA